MPGGFAPRFAIEAGFLILLGVGAGVADLSTGVIVALLAGAWIIVSLIELAVWRAGNRPAPAPAAVSAQEPEPEPEDHHGWPIDDETPFEPDDTAYPLRADAGTAPSEEVEAYTRVMSGEGSEPSGSGPDEPAE
jgi:hypothetical protein